MDKLENIRSVVVPAVSQNVKAKKPGIFASDSTQPVDKQSVKRSIQTSLNNQIKSAVPTKTLADNVKVKEEKVREAVKEINNALVKLQSELGFSVDKVANDVVVTVKRKESGEVVRQIPSESILKLAHNFEKLKGVLMDELY